jgi:hypothetical protein
MREGKGSLARESLKASPLFDVKRFAGRLRRALKMIMEAHGVDDAERRFHLVVSRQRH